MELKLHFVGPLLDIREHFGCNSQANFGEKHYLWKVLSNSLKFLRTRSTKMDVDPKDMGNNFSNQKGFPENVTYSQG